MKADTVSHSFMRQISPLMVAVLSGFVAIGVALPVLPDHVHHTLGFGTLVVGLVTGTQFAASLLSRFHAGTFADMYGGKRAMQVGLLLTSAGGMVYLLSFIFAGRPMLSVIILLAGRAIIGGAESFIITGGMTFGLSMAGPGKTGRVITWVGTAMFAALALGAPIGSFLLDLSGFLAIAVATIILPMASLLVVNSVPVIIVKSTSRGSVPGTLGRVWLPGLGAAFNGVGFSALIAFVVLVYAQNGWGLAWLPLTVFACALMAARLVFGQLVDSAGGWRVGFFFTPMMAAGQFLIWAASSPWLAAFGAGLIGAGWAMVFPAFGAEAVRRTEANNKGLAMAAYSAFPDLSIGLSGPILGLLAVQDNVQGIYMWSAAVVLAAIPVAVFLRKEPAAGMQIDE